MTEAGNTFHSLRLSRFENERLIFALLLSLAVHLAVFGGYEIARGSGLFQRLHRVAKVRPVPLPVENSEQPLEFVTVDQPSAEPPKNAKYYSSQNSRAANPNADQDTDTPQLNGKQTDVPKTEDVPRMQLSKLQPSPPAQQPQSQPTPSPGDLTLGKPDNSQQPEPQKPRKIREALAQNHLPGLKMRQDGGVRRHLEISAFDAKATSYGQYDELLIDAVTQHWYDLLDQNNFADDRQGKVILQFHLHSDGSVTDLMLVGDTTDDAPGGLWAIVCEAAIEKTAPFAPWPIDMLHEIGSNFREVQFIFYY
jgi:outer membrane biosynthesis protein TonB